MITLLYGNSSEYWPMSDELLFISSSNNVIRSGVVGKLVTLQALLEATVDDIDDCILVVNNDFCMMGSFSSCWS